MVDLNAKAAEIQGAATLPLGWGVRPDRRTNNLIVHNGHVGFVITSVCLQDWSLSRIVKNVNAAVDVAAFFEGYTPITMQTLEELDAQALQRAI